VLGWRTRGAPKAPARKVWLSLMMEVYHLQKRHPDAGGFRMWSLLARPEISPPYTFFLLNDDMKLNRNRQFLI
jgi:hypothetical protein